MGSIAPPLSPFLSPIYIDLISLISRSHLSTGRKIATTQHLIYSFRFLPAIDRTKTTGYRHFIATTHSRSTPAALWSIWGNDTCEGGDYTDVKSDLGSSFMKLTVVIKCAGLVGEESKGKGVSVRVREEMWS